MIGNIILTVILVVLIGSAVAYIIKEKKKGVKCIGCSSGGSCACGCKAKSETK